MKPTSNARTVYEGERRNADVGEHPQGIDHLQPTPVGDHDPWLMCRRSAPGMAAVEPADQRDLQNSVDHRMAGMRMEARQSLQPLFGLLVPLYVAWEMANWFVKPNPWLSGRKPVDDCTDRLPAVLDVAHLEYFIASGEIEPHVLATGRSDACSIDA